MRLLHHSKPEISILEVAPESENALTAPLFLQRDDLNDIIGAIQANVACQEESTKSRLLDDPNFNQTLQVEILDLSEHSSAENAETSKFDVILVPNVAAYGSKPELALENLIRVLNAGGKLCILGNDNDVDQVKAILKTSQVKTTLLNATQTSQGQRSGILII